MKELASVKFPDGEYGAYDASLVEAAPDLLEAAKRVSCFRPDMKISAIEGSPLAIKQSAFRALEDAINKAEGK